MSNYFYFSFDFINPGFVPTAGWITIAHTIILTSIKSRLGG